MYQNVVSIPRPDFLLDRRDTIVGQSRPWREVMSRVDLVAATQATVLLLGETGTGKEVVARAIHRRSSRRENPFVTINCAALPATLIESELFGRERGAFTGAHATQAGRFELAHRGTLLLDEIGELPPELQVKLLRVLQESRIERLGRPNPIDVDVRVIASTNRDLAAEVRDGRFRRDLYYRLNVFPILLPPLRERPDDLPLLVAHLVSRFSRILQKPVDSIEPGVVEALQAHPWPGNIRELENVIQRAIILSSNGVLSTRDLDLMSDPGQPGPDTSTTSLRLADVEREHIHRVVAAASWRIEGPRGAASVLGLRPSTLRSRLRKLGLRR
jgi:formate hydrogenlyase transcriptional activator